MEKQILLTEPVLTALKLAKLWPGMPKHKLVEHLEKIGNRAVPDFESTDGVADFPQPFWAEGGTRVNPITLEKVTSCLPWQTEKHSADSTIRKFWRRCIAKGGDSLSKLFDEVVFKYAEVKRYEENHPEVLYQIVDPDVAWKDELLRKPDLSPVSELKERLAETEEKLKKSRRISKRRSNKIAKLEEEIAQMRSSGPTTVKAALWEKSVDATFNLLVNILQGSNNDKMTWKKEEFIDALPGRYSEYHTIVVEMAWEKLPESYKLGRGRPKKNQ